MIKLLQRGSGWLHASLQPATLLGLVMIATCWVAVVRLTSTDYDKTLEGGIQQSESLVRLFEEGTVQTVSAIDRTLLLLRTALENDPSHFDLRHWSDRTALIGDLTIQISIFGPDGLMRATTTDYKGTLYVGDREHFLVHINSDVDKLFVSNPVLGRASGKWSIQLSRRLRGPDDRFDGIIIASLDPDFIQRFYETVDLGSHGSVVLRTMDGVILAARGLTGPTVGREGTTPMLRAALAKSPTGYYWGGGAIDGVDRLVGYRVFERYPLIGTVGRAESVIFQTYWHNEQTYQAVGLIITVLVLIAIVGATQYQARLNRVRDDLHRSEAEIRERAQHLERKSRELGVTLEYMSQGIIMIDSNNDVPVINRRAVELLGLPDSFPVDRLATEDLLKDDRKCVGFGLVGSEDSSNNIQVYQRTLPNGTVLEIHNASLGDGGTVRTITDITERKRAEQQIVHIAHHDALTGLANRMLIGERIDQAFGEVERRGGSFAILCIDLDRFKNANDTFGHQVGDSLLRHVADRLRKCVRDIDAVARVGGDEFIVLQTKITESDDASVLAERILRAVSAPYNINGNAVVIGASIGIAVAPSDSANADELLGHADLALYRAKSNGRNGFSFFDAELGQIAMKRARLEMELRQALVRGEFEVWYQPWVNIVNGSFAGCEALLRWRHPLRGLIGPADFIPAAEETGLIGQLGELVLQRACRDAAKWPSHIRLAINLSAAQFTGGKLPKSVVNALATHGLAATRLELEITETIIIDDYDEPREALVELRRHGISIALDDFGIGYSSLKHLRQLLIDRIKIDRSFVAEMTTRADSAAIVAAIVGLGKSLGISVTAEGVETVDQLSILTAVGCTEAQGYLFGRPCPAGEILKILSDSSSVDNVVSSSEPNDLAASDFLLLRSRIGGRAI